MPAKPNKNPIIAFIEIEVRDLIRTIKTSHNGKVAPIIEPRPAEIYFNPHVESVLFKKKLRSDSISTVRHSLPLGIALPFATKKNTYASPPMNCLIAASCSAGIYFTPWRDAIHVVPQKKETRPSATRALVLVPFL